jgi:tellurite resistance protein
LQLAGEYVECSGCNGTYKLQVLDHDPERERTEFEAQFAQAVKHVLVRMMVADGRVKSGEIEAVMSMYERVTGQELPLSEVVDLFSTLGSFAKPINDVLCDMSPVLNEEGKQLVIKAAFFVAASDGCVDASEYQMLESIGAALEMQPSQVEAVVTSLTEAA